MMMEVTGHYCGDFALLAMGSTMRYLVEGIEDISGKMMASEYDLKRYAVVRPTEEGSVSVTYAMLPGALQFGRSKVTAKGGFLSLKTAISADAKVLFADEEDVQATSTVTFTPIKSSAISDAKFAIGSLAEVSASGRVNFVTSKFESIASAKFAFASDLEEEFASALFYFATKHDKFADGKFHMLHISDVAFIRDFLAEYIPTLRTSREWGASIYFLRPAEAARVIFPPHPQEMNKVIVFLRGYMLQVTITNSTSENLVDFQVPITVNSLSLILQRKMREDCADIRVYDSDKVTPLPFWVEKHTIKSTSTRVWVKVPVIPAGGSKTIYISYGDLQASSLSDGVATFDFFTDFDTPLDPSFWYVNANNYTISNSVLRINVGAIGLQNPLSFAFNGGYIIEGRIQYNSFGETAYSGVLGTSSSRFTQSGNAGADALALYMVNSPSGNTDVRCWGATGVSPSYDVAEGTFLFYASANTWYVLGIGVTPSSLSFWKDYSLLQNYAGISWAKDMRYLSLGAFHGNAAYNVKDTSYDWVRVRKFRENPPTTSVGEESLYPYIRTLPPSATEAIITNQAAFSAPTLVVVLWYV